MVYQWKGGFPTRGAEAQAVGERINALRQLNGGKFTPRIVVDDARDGNAPTHACFEWDDAKAADQHRLHQARTMIRNIVIVSDAMPEETHAFVCIQYEGDEGKSYTSVAAVMANPSLRAQFVDEAKRQLALWRKKYRECEELVDVFDVIDRQLETAA